MTNQNETAEPTGKQRGSGSLLMRLVMFFRCAGGHDWTGAAMDGKPPTDDQVANGIDGFYDYATMYCKRCGHVSKLS